MMSFFDFFTNGTGKYLRDAFERTLDSVEKFLDPEVNANRMKYESLERSQDMTERSYGQEAADMKTIEETQEHGVSFGSFLESFVSDLFSSTPSEHSSNSYDDDRDSGGGFFSNLFGGNDDAGGGLFGSNDDSNSGFFGNNDPYDPPDPPDYGHNGYGDDDWNR
jgi:hypothetical protein